MRTNWDLAPAWATKSGILSYGEVEVWFGCPEPATDNKPDWYTVTGKSSSDYHRVSTFLRSENLIVDIEVRPSNAAAYAIVPGYETLHNVLNRAYEQAAKGKGKERHAGDLPFDEQPMQQISDLLNADAGMAFQACKKIHESRGLPHDAKIRELLGAINYIAGMVIWHERHHQCAEAPTQKS